MKKLLIALSVVLLMTACQKEASFEDPNSTPGGGGNNPQGMLTRMVLVAGADSSVIDLGYDAAKRLQVYRSSNPDPDDNVYKRIIRNSAGVITQYVTTDELIRSFGLDSLVTIVAFNTAQNQYTYSLSTIVESGVTYRDSTAYTYDGGGNLSQRTSYWQVGPSSYEPYQRYEYTYASGNIVSEKYFADDGTGTLQQAFIYNYAFDDKINPLKLGAESMIVLEDASYFGNNNVSTLNFVDGTSPANNSSLAFTYTYNMANKPTFGTAVQNPGGGSFNLRYYYN